MARRGKATPQMARLRKDILGTFSGASNLGSKTLALMIMARWKSLARKRLNSSREAYVYAVRMRKTGKRTWTVYLGNGPKGSEELPGLVENGQPAYDLRSVLLAGGVKSLKGSGQSAYLNVPFTHAAKSLSGAQLRRAQRLAPTRDKSVALSKRAQKMLSGQHGGRRRFPAGTTPRQSGHSTDILDGLTRLLTGVERKTRQSDQSTYYTAINRYTTWRRISWNSPLSKWQHPGIRARNLLAATLASFDSDVDKVLNA